MAKGYQGLLRTPAPSLEGHSPESGRYAAGMDLTVLDEELAVCRLPSGDPLPAWMAGPFISVTRTINELSVVCAAVSVPALVTADRGWRGLRVEGPLPFALVGLLATMSATLAAAEISVFVISTYDTDYILVKDVDLARAVVVLEAEGHEIGTM